MQRARFPARQLKRRTIKSAALGYLCPVFLRKFAKSRRMALKKRGIKFVELEMPVTAHLKVYNNLNIS